MVGVTLGPDYHVDEGQFGYLGSMVYNPRGMNGVADIMANFTNISLQNPAPDPMCNGTEEMPKFRQVTKILDMYFVPFIIMVGLVGNTLSFLVFVRTRLRRLSASVYLAALALSDNGFLLCVLVSWSTNVGVALYNTMGWCQAFVYLSYVCSFLSVWYVIGFTVERYIAVCFPFQRGTMCTVRRAKMVVIGLALGAAVLYCWGLWTSRTQALACSGVVLCQIDPQHMTLVNAMSNVDTICTLLLPCPILIVINGRIIWELRLRKTTRLTLQSSPNHHLEPRAQDSLVNKSSDNYSPERRGRGAHKHPKCTRTLLAISSMFLLLNLPAHSLRIFLYFATMVDPFYSQRLGLEYVAVQEFFTYLFYINFSVNVFLYSFCGANFRRSVVMMLCRHARYEGSASREATMSISLRRLTSATGSVNSPVVGIGMTRSTNGSYKEIVDL